MKNDIWQSFGLDLDNIRIWISAKPRPIPNVIWLSHWLHHVNINVYAKFQSQYFTQFKNLGHFHFFRIWSSAKPRPLMNVILQFLELDIVNINVSAKFYQNIPNGLRVKFYCFQNLSLGKTSTNPKCPLTISWATSCQYQCICKISSQYSTQFKR